MEKTSIGRDVQLVMIAGSAGSFQLLLQLIGRLVSPVPFAVIVLLHRKEDMYSSLARILNMKTNIQVRELEEKETIEPNHIYIAPADYHLLIERDRSFSLDYSERVNHSRPSFDITFESAARVFGSGVACLLLSGANADGAKGLRDVIAHGGQAFIQDPATAEMPTMPESAARMNPNARVLTPEEMEAILTIWQH